MSDIEQNAQNAQSVLDNPMFQEAFEAVRQGIEVQIETSDVSDAEGRNQAGLMLMALAGVKMQLFSHLETKQLDE